MIWEYTKGYTNSGTISVEKLNELGALGWEHYNTVGNVFFFKRVVEKRALNEPPYKGVEQRDKNTAQDKIKKK